MRKVTEAKVAFFATFVLLFSLSTLTLAQGRRIYLDFRNQTLSASIEEAPLRDILKRIKQKRGIWFKAWSKGKPILDEKVSVRFRGLPVQEGMERIFSEFNHSLIFDQDSIVGVMLFGKPGKRTYKGRRRSVRRRR